MNIVVEKLPHPEHSGDWHDAPSRWVVKGPDNEIQKFSIKKDAEHYARVRKRTKDMTEAGRVWMTESFAREKAERERKKQAKFAEYRIRYPFAA